MTAKEIPHPPGSDPTEASEQAGGVTEAPRTLSELKQLLLGPDDQVCKQAKSLDAGSLDAGPPSE